MLRLQEMLTNKRCRYPSSPPSWLSYPVVAEPSALSLPLAIVFISTQCWVSLLGQDDSSSDDEEDELLNERSKNKEPPPSRQPKDSKVGALL